MEIELTPEPEAEIADAVAAAVDRALRSETATASDPGPWWRAGIRESLQAGGPYPGRP